jgi:hypothetical protein
MDKKEKEDKRKKRWSKRICIKEEQYEFIKEVQQKKKYKTMAGTLDNIINNFKDYGKSKNDISN